MTCKRGLVALLIVAAAWVAVRRCSTTWTSDTPLPGEVRSKVARESSRAAAPDLRALVAGNSGFALDLYRQVSAVPGNASLAPLSISTALAMTHSGARGETAHEMAAALHFTLPPQRLHAAFGTLEDLEARYAAGAGMPVVRSANALFAQRGSAIEATFLDVLSRHYGCGVGLVDFAAHPGAANRSINRWVASRTGGKIRDLLGPATPDRSTILFVVSAVYFNARWDLPFERKDTATGTFNGLDGQPSRVPMMHQTERLAYTAADRLQAVQLPYRGGPLAMLLLVPDRGRFGEIESALDGVRLATLLLRLRERPVHLAMPRFTIESRVSLVESLRKLGMRSAFHNMSADFSGIVRKGGGWLGGVDHKSFVAVGEYGTEAAAGSDVYVTVSDHMTIETPVELTIDRPFLYLIRDTETGAILFMGRVAML
ncbi:MAG: serpin family protein [Armatimonadetes bacterium]|nr:serpin family protein [Armatimonadota bacterium]